LFSAGGAKVKYFRLLPSQKLKEMKIITSKFFFLKYNDKMIGYASMTYPSE